MQDAIHMCLPKHLKLWYKFGFPEMHLARLGRLIYLKRLFTLLRSCHDSPKSLLTHTIWYAIMQVPVTVHAIWTSVESILLLMLMYIFQFQRSCGSGSLFPSKVVELITIKQRGISARKMNNKCIHFRDTFSSSRPQRASEPCACSFTSSPRLNTYRVRTSQGYFLVVTPP